jgi:glycosyltransferase involved in cell wall biosynthesis
VKRITYITFNDVPSGIYYSQVTDTCAFLRDELRTDVKLIAFISLRGFFENKRKIKATGVNATVFPMFPRPRNWRKNRFMFRFLINRRRPDVVIARGAYATVLALEAVKDSARVVFDARGAYHAELTEYDVSGSAEMRNEIASVEREAVLQSKFRIGVSKKLVEYWGQRYGYSSDQHAVIPCTLNSNYARGEFLSSPGDKITIVYAGSGSGWQTLNQLDELLLPVLQKQKNVHVVLLAKDVQSLKIKAQFPDRVRIGWLSPSDVQQELLKADYGWLVRESSVTNLVSSPVKFAEYLAAGLKVITSQGMGDNAEFVLQHEAGLVIESTVPVLAPVSLQDKQRMRDLADRFYTKKNYVAEYRRVIG